MRIPEVVLLGVALFAARPAAGDEEVLEAFRAGKSLETFAERERLVKAEAALERRDFAAVLELTSGATGDDVTGIRLLAARASAVRTAKRWREGLEAWTKVVDAAKRLGWLGLAGKGMHEAGVCAFVLRQRDTALAVWTERLALERRRGDPAGLADALSDLGHFHAMRKENDKALAYLEQARTAAERAGDRRLVGKSLFGIGVIHKHRGRLEEALECQQAALRIYEALRHETGLRTTVSSVGVLLKDLGRPREALAHLERAVALHEKAGDRPQTAIYLVPLAALQNDAGRLLDARDSYERALAIARGNPALRDSVASACANLGMVYESLGDHPRAVRQLRLAMPLFRALRDRNGVASCLGNLGIVYASMAEYDEALEHQRRALDIYTEVGSDLGVARTRLNMGLAYRARGDYARSLEVNRQALEVAEGAGDDALAARALQNLGALKVELGEREAAVGLLERSYELKSKLGRRSDAALTQVALAMVHLALGNDDQVFDRLGRALETMDELGDAYGSLFILGNLAHAHIGRLDADEAIRDIQRKAKAAADVLYPEAASLETIQAGLVEGDVLLSYALMDGFSITLVVTRDGAHVRQLPEVESVRELVAELAVDAPGAEWRTAAADLRSTLIEALDLPEGTRRLLISPHDELCYLPFTLVAGEYEIAYVPSGTTYGLLRAERTDRGEGVLAIGDPHYSAAPVVTLMRSGNRLGRIPASGEEARAVGDVTLLGEHATPDGLVSALGKRRRWRAVHLACHGLMVPEQPRLSTLALTGGFLTTLDLYRIRIPADLVVLSACETAKGRIYAGEGVVGFTRAFLFAGASSVVVSLWKVDDEATKALMVRFYELWKPGKLSTAAALRQAQEHVASQPKWKHPYYWAAWQLWGLPD